MIADLISRSEKRSDDTRDSISRSRKLPEVFGRSQKPSDNELEQAYQSLLPKLLAVRPSDLVPINISIPNAVMKAMGFQSTLINLNDRIAKELPAVDAGLLEQLITHALALSHAHTRFVTTSQGSDALPSLRAEGKKLRAILLSEARTQIRRGLIEPEPLRNLKNDPSYRNLAVDLQILAQAFRPYTSSPGLTSVRPEEVQRAEQISMMILRLFGRRSKDLRADIEAAADMRKRAFTLFVHMYEEARRVVVYLRWHQGDADELAPLLHAKERQRKKKAAMKTTTEVPSS